MDVTQNARTVMERRYLKKGMDGRPLEGPEDMLRRVSKNIAMAEKNYGKGEDDIKMVEDEFFEVMDNLYFLPNSPTLMNAGRDLQQLSACFVLPIDDTMESIFGTLKDAALIHKSGGGTGFSFSRIRPKEDVVMSTMGVSSGPVSFMKVFNAATEAIKQGGTRRGANMGILRVDHPDILDFITSKAEDDQTLSNFNISVAMTEEFMKAMKNNEDYELRNPRDGKVTGKLNAKEVFDLIVHMAWKTGDPGIVFLDRINAENPTPHVGEIESTNPCGEQPLLPHESCNLGSINLTRIIKDGDVDWDTLKKTVRTSVHFLDNVIDMNLYPIMKIEKTAKASRAIGVGVMGEAEMIAHEGIMYGSDEHLKFIDEKYGILRKAVEDMSHELALEKGSYPEFEGSRWTRPMRNGYLMAIAPTSSISILVGTTQSTEPVYKKKWFEENLSGLIPVTAPGINPDNYNLYVNAYEVDQLAMVRAAAVRQKHVDQGMSLNIFVDPENITGKYLSSIYMLAWKLGLKSTYYLRSLSPDEEKGLSIPDRSMECSGCQ